MKEEMLQELLGLAADSPFIEKRRLFMRRVMQNAWTQQIDEKDHFCCFFVPVVKESQEVFMGHHIKADMWLPPGGHMDEGEQPRETVRREMEEELRYEAKPDEPVFFGLSIVEITNPNIACRKHWDLWYAVVMDEAHRFNYDRGEFYEASWLPFEESVRRIGKHATFQRKDYVKVLQSVREVI